jgi:hypothetical protein
MVTGRIILAAMLFGLGISATAATAPPAKKKPVPAEPAPDSAAAKIVQNCDAHKFETVVHELVDGQPHQSKVKLCGKTGQSDSEWIGTLKDAISKLNANKEMAVAVRDQIVSALNAEILRLETGIEFSGHEGSKSSVAKKSVLDGISPGRGLAELKQSQASSLPPPRPTARPGSAPEYAALPPLPTAPPAPTHVMVGGVSASVPMLPKPQMTLSCYTPGETPEGPCTGFTRETLVTVRAGEDLPANTSLRFVRDGDPKADVQLAQLKKGKSMRLAVPTDVCRHVVGGSLELRIVRAGQEVGSDGPYNLNC